MKTLRVSDEYKVSERVTLRVGDVFRAKGGPYYLKRDARGNKVRLSMAARGPFRFMRYCVQGKREWIEAVAKDGTAAVISLTKRRSVLPGSLITRPYVVVGKTGGKKRRSTVDRSSKPVVRRKKREAAAPEAAAPKSPASPTAPSQGVLFSVGDYVLTDTVE